MGLAVRSATHFQGREAYPTHATVCHAVQFAPLKAGIAKLYNESSGLWESMWGEHMHHGQCLGRGGSGLGGRAWSV